MKKLLPVLFFTFLLGSLFGQTEFCVNMNNFTGSFNTVFISGTFNAWDGGANPLSDSNGDGIWCAAVDIPAESDYKFQLDEWTVQEEFSVGDPCTISFNGGEFVNRLYNGEASVCFDWNTCNTCANPGGDMAGEDTGGDDNTGGDAGNVNFSVDMNGYTDPFTTVYISGAFNSWSDVANPLSDDDGDGIWSTMIDMPVGSEYKFQLDGFAVQEQFEVDAPCTASFFGEFETFTNRVYDGGTDVCFAWSTCDACGDGSNTGNGGGNQDITFSVDMNGYNSPFTTVYISGTFNAWSDVGNPLSDEDGDGIWSGSADMSVGDEYKFQVDGFSAQEQFEVDAPCTVSFFGEFETFTNRVYDGSADVCFIWSTCDICGEGGGGAEEVLSTTTFSVDMNVYEGDPFGTVYVSGSLNGWSGESNPMSDEDGDGIWTTDIILPNGPYEYLFTIDNFTDQEVFTPDTDCTITTGEFTNRIIEISENSTVCFVWNSCSTACGSVGGGSDDGGNMDNGEGNDGGNDGGETTTTLFADYSWLSSVVDPDNCEGTTIQVYRSAGFIYLNIITANSAILYNASGILYCSGTPTYNCQDFYTVDEEIEVYTCGSGNTDNGGGNDDGGNMDGGDGNDDGGNMDNGGGNDDGGNMDGGDGNDGGGTTTTLFADYSWLSSVVDPNNCEGTSILAYKSAGFDYLYVQTATSSILYNGSGTLYCSTLPNFNCLEFYTVDEIIEEYTCGGGNSDGGNDNSGDDGESNDDSGTMTTLFADYSWLSGVVDANNCAGTSILAYKSAGFDYLYVQTATSSILYNGSGTLYCTSLPNFNCLDFYTVDEVIEEYTCGGGQIAEQGVTPAFKTSVQGSNTVGLATDFTVYPNPSNGLFFVELTTNADIDRTLTILNMQGQIIQQQFLAATTAVQKVEMNLANQAAGMYFIRVSSKEGSSVERLIVK